MNSEAKFQKVATNPFVIIRHHYEALSTAERRVADYVLNHAADVAPAPISETAQSAGVSEATVVRFCRSLGYKGYLEFKFRLACNLNNPVRVLHDHITQQDTIAEIMQKTIVSGIAALQHTLNLLEPDALSDAVAAIQNARLTLILGVGTSIPFTEDLYNKLMRLDLNCLAITDPYLQLMRIALLDERDTVIALSHTGASIDPVNALYQARQKGARTVAITGSAFSPLTNHADIILLYGARETRLEAVIARLGLLAVSDALYMALAMQNIQQTNSNEKTIWELVLDKVTDT